MFGTKQQVPRGRNYKEGGKSGELNGELSAERNALMITRITLAAAIVLGALTFACAEDTAEEKAFQDALRAGRDWSWAWGDYCRRNILAEMQWIGN